MEEIAVEVSSPPTEIELAEGWMLKISRRRVGSDPRKFLIQSAKLA